MKNKKIILIIVAAVILIAAFAAWYYFKKVKTPAATPATVTPPATTNTTTVTEGAPTSTVITEISPIGQAVFANTDGVVILYIVDATMQSKKNKGDFCGIVAGQTTLGGAKFYTLGDGGLVVGQDLVTFNNN